MSHAAGTAVMNESLAPGERVEVRKRFDASWARGFELAEVTDTGVRVRRLSDGEILPIEFDLEDVRPERERKKGMWWY